MIDDSLIKTLVLQLWKIPVVVIVLILLGVKGKIRKIVLSFIWRIFGEVMRKDRFQETSIQYTYSWTNQLVKRIKRILNPSDAMGQKGKRPEENHQKGISEILFRLINGQGGVDGRIKRGQKEPEDEQNPQMSDASDNTDR